MLDDCCWLTGDWLDLHAAFYSWVLADKLSACCLPCVPLRFSAVCAVMLRCRYFLDNVAGWILELDRGSGIPFEGNYSGEGQCRGSMMQRATVISAWSCY
jgi:hypothetical protein